MLFLLIYLLNKLLIIFMRHASDSASVIINRNMMHKILQKG